MDSLLLGLIKSLASSLSVYQFSLVLIMLVLAVAATVIFISKRTGTSIIDIIKKSPKDPILEKIESLNKDVLDHSTKNTEHVQSLVASLVDLNEYLKQTEQLIRKQSSDTLSIKREINTLIGTLTSELSDLKHHLKMHDNANTTSFELVKTSISNSEQAIKQVVNKLEKLDDYARSAFPEFKSYHRDLDSSLRQIQTDIVIVSNLIKIHNTSGPTLR